MRIPIVAVLLVTAIAFVFTFTHGVVAQDDKPAVEVEQSKSPAADAQPAITVSSADDQAVERTHERRRFERHDNVIIHFGKDAALAAGMAADAVVAVGGSASSAGEVTDAVISVFGNTTVTGPTGDAAVAIFGNTIVNNEVGGEVVAVFGDVTLGPQAEVYGDLVAVGGSIIRDPAAIVHGHTREVSFWGDFGRFEWLRPWFQKCLLYGRPLAFEPGLSWAWTVAFGFLGFYVLLALVAPGGVRKCMTTLEEHPGHSLLAALLTMLLTPVVSMLLLVTIIGIAGVPFLWLGLFVAGLFGKAVVLAVIGRRLTSNIGVGPLSDVAFSVLLGGLVVMGLYVIPVLGFLIYKLLGFVGLGVVVYTLILAARDRRDSRFAAAAAARSQASVASVEPNAVAMAAASVTADPAIVEPAVAMDSASSAAGAHASEASPTGGTASIGAAAAGATEPQVATASLPRAGFWIRMGALFIDFMLIAIAFSAVSNTGDVALLALAAYGALMWKLKGTTVGGILCRIQVVRVDGREVDWATSIIRALSCFLSLACVGLGFLWIVFDDDRQAWHDKIAGTAVVRVPRGWKAT